MTETQFFPPSYLFGAMRRQALIGTGVVIFVVLFVAWLAATGRDLVLNRDQTARRYVADLVAALNSQNCTALYPVTGEAGLDTERVCPRGDVGNFMVIDKVEYKLHGVIGKRFSARRQALLETCITARGVAAWNEGTHEEGCTTDPRIIELRVRGGKWTVDPQSFTHLAQLISTAGEKPASFEDIWRRSLRGGDCPESERSGRIFRSCLEERLAAREVLGLRRAVAERVRYAIRTHELPPQGRAH